MDVINAQVQETRRTTNRINTQTKQIKTKTRKSGPPKPTLTYIIPRVPKNNDKEENIKYPGGENDTLCKEEQEIHKNMHIRQRMMMERLL